MALTKCSECGREVSDKATTCPQCGAPVMAPAPTPALQAGARPAPTKRRVGPLTLLLVVLLGIVAYTALKVRAGASVSGVFTGPQKIIAETVDLKEGQAMGYGFSLPSPRRVEVTVNANPKPVNVMLMNEADWAKYNQVRGKLFGSEYTFRQALSRQSVLHMKQGEVLPAGAWRIVVERPQETLPGRKDTAATVSIVGY